MKASSETIASDRVTDRQCEEAERDGDQNDVQHGMLRVMKNSARAV